MSGFTVSNALVAAILLGGLLPVFGRYLVLSRSIMLGLAVPQWSMAGIALLFLGHALGWSWCESMEEETTRATVGAILLTVPCLVTLAVFQRSGRRLSEAWLAFGYLAAVSASNLMMSCNAVGETYLGDLFHGRLILISDAMLQRLAWVLAGVGGASLLVQRRLTLVTCDGDFSAVSGVAVIRWRVALAIAQGMVIGTAVSAGGPIVAFGFLILPCLTAAVISRSLVGHLGWSVAIGLGAALLGHWAAYRWDLPLGDTMVAVSAVMLVAVRLSAMAWRRHR